MDGRMDGEVEEGIHSQSSGNGVRSPTPFSSRICGCFGGAFSTTYSIVEIQKVVPWNSTTLQS
jgi:hypothetical protein